MYQDWGKYEDAIAHHQQSLELYEQLDKQKDVADSWYWLADCYRNWGQYEKAIESEQKDLAIRQQLDDQPRIALAYYQLGRIYQDWGKYEEAIAHHQQSRDLYQQIGHNERTARSYRYICKTQRLLAQTTSDTTAALTLLSQAEENIRQSIQINTKNDYKKNQGYDCIALALIYAERFHQLPADDFNLSEQINQFQTNYTLGLTHLRQLGQTVDSAEETLDIARAYLRIDPIKWTECTESRDEISHIWEPLNQAETLTRAALETFQAYNRRKLQTAAQQLLEEIEQRRADDNQPKSS
ncbi:tetratricopeptide repeat protein [Coleofasciculus sp. A1-SPW-01]|uniref:tetratricopeptide repeat protein n=1 Tax=Coleofasciculus sp. A1-SPW-01 TaxID=3070819 RepID=UPI004063E59B